jgi:oligopeptidase B
VPHKAGTLIIDMAVFAGHLARLERANGLPRIIIRDLKTGNEHAIAFDEEAYSLGMSAGYEFDTTSLRFSYSSMTTPSQVFDYDMASRERTLRKTQAVPSGHNPDDYVTRRIMAPAADGEQVPVSLLYHKDTALDGSSPVWLYGYGSYGISIPAGFNTNILSLADRGFIYALAHIRGGKDKGYGWYKAGKMMTKKNTFEDFIAAGRHLVAEGFTREGNIVAQGGSAGGMLMGAVANMAPDLWRGIIAEVPFVDVLNTMLDDTLPLTPPEWNEWGNPIASKEAFEYMRAYSPLRQCGGEGLSQHPRRGRADRPARDLLGTGQVGRQASRTQDRRQPAAAQDADGRGPRRRAGPLRPAEGRRAGLCLRAAGDGEGVSALHA